MIHGICKILFAAILLVVVGVLTGISWVSGTPIQFVSEVTRDDGSVVERTVTYRWFKRIL